ALLGGQVDLLFDQAANSLPQVKGDRIKAFAVTAAKHLAAAPDIPTVDEAGVPGFYTAVWHRAWGPKGTPAAGIAKLNKAGGGARGSCRSSAAASLGRARSGAAAARAANAAGARRVAEGRDRQMVADHQIGRDQGRMTESLAAPSGSHDVRSRKGPGCR